ncbi:ethanolamine ammonia-lyase subunit EutC [Leptospira sp. 2 VSF19]|uniref:Ethanolamine ammonia-lyase small subunit n=1 Tax=Leptospira soteropolitanensis TaxID=2950025 RepID=A0AAW5VPV0_9LEPT|nr:ethanolamine ammonia-lyase subunit EutC [Leptospira soteropolitanensis]MCW7493576.1 ethanolamine ammonia-lyase subunit EutC [Leptospira soteropolitanensis]MCW7501175.1 ethanolamine ammonia-lyase subunit EutC [Leptospira soteropolitanensis]MCW7523639.1 ethanolamine ammonia-lyase subunit EutC [Leptospira soteropolitanensis]MCW7527288.1 ethanolamine ammonia-lyase subunit EutC [Leptospira soteropolitanensis]MCW7531145.1 ethanolamine ammonia-lyase subunit EutC [Leptospira soteropolitanensis]
MTFLEEWKQFSQARIGLTRTGGSISTKDMLRFRLDHARARDAVLLSPDFAKLLKDLEVLGKPFSLPALLLESQVSSKEEYLMRPDLGRRLSTDSLETIQKFTGEYDLVLMGIDGLSAKALDENYIPFLKLLMNSLSKTGLRIAPLVLTKWGRVAIGDEVGEVLNAKVSVVMIGERPGLSSADSLGVYITYRPQVGKTDESRNCISNIRPDGLVLESAANKTVYLITEVIQRKLSGVGLKDEMAPEFLREKKEGTRMVLGSGEVPSQRSKK